MCKQSKNSWTTKIGEQILCGCSISTMLAFDHRENKHTSYLWIFKRASKKHNWFWKEKNVTKEELKTYEDGRNCYICARRMLIKTL